MVLAMFFLIFFIELQWAEGDCARWLKPTGGGGTTTVCGVGLLMCCFDAI